MDTATGETTDRQQPAPLLVVSAGTVVANRLSLVPPSNYEPPRAAGQILLALLITIRNEQRTAVADAA